MYEYAERREDWFRVKKEVEKAMYCFGIMTCYVDSKRVIRFELRQLINVAGYLCQKITTSPGRGDRQYSGACSPRALDSSMPASESCHSESLELSPQT